MQLDVIPPRRILAVAQPLFLLLPSRIFRGVNAFHLRTTETTCYETERRTWYTAMALLVTRKYLKYSINLLDPKLLVYPPRYEILRSPSDICWNLEDRCSPWPRTLEVPASWWPGLAWPLGRTCKRSLTTTKRRGRTRTRKFFHAPCFTDVTYTRIVDIHCREKSAIARTSIIFFVAIKYVAAVSVLRSNRRYDRVVRDSLVQRSSRESTMLDEIAARQRVSTKEHTIYLHESTDHGDTTNGKGLPYRRSNHRIQMESKPSSWSASSSLLALKSHQHTPHPTTRFVSTSYYP